MLIRLNLLRRPFGIFSTIKDKVVNKAMGKDLIGEDMYGNKYYQIYDPDDFPIKREVVYKQGLHNGILDPI